MIISGGENIYSIEVENAISTLSGVQRVAVIGVPHDMWGEAVHAVVELAGQDVEVTERAVIAHARGRLAGYKVPKSVELTREPLPVSPAGKILTRALRDRWARG